MPPRSPTLAFAPTPALEHNSWSQFNGRDQFGQMDMDEYCMNQPVKEVHFQERPSNSMIHGRHSIATSNVPLLPAVASASHLPKQAFRIANPSPSVDITAYFEQCRNVNEQLRSAHEQERKAWEIERMALKTRIADLEFKLNKSRDRSRRLSNESHTITKPVFSPPTEPPKPALPVPSHLQQPSNPPIWQPESPLPATRVFSHEDSDINHLPSISEDGPADLNDLSPHTSHENVPIHIQDIDKGLDGIIVKSEGVKSSFDKVISPIITGSPARSPSPKPPQVTIIEPPPSHMQIDTSDLPDPLDEKLKKNAGHTPLTFEGALSSTVSTEGLPTPREEIPKEPVPTTRPPLRPLENSNSYFSTEDIHAPAPPAIPVPPPEMLPEIEEAVLEPDDPEPTLAPPEGDKPLSGPLMLDPAGKTQQAHIFLEKLDQQLENVVKRSQDNSPETSPDAMRRKLAQREAEHKSRDEEDMPRLRMRQSTNFGSAYGLNVPGHM